MRVFHAHGLGFSIAACTWLLVMPCARAAESDALGPDKALHYTVSVSLTLGASAVFDLIGLDEPATLPLSIGFALALGVGKETFDALRGSDFSAADLTWDVLGIATGVFVRVLVCALLEPERAHAKARASPEAPFARLTSF
jgi:putative lipoprotein